MRGIADTGFIVAFARENDQYHGWALDLAARVKDPLLTCEPVVPRQRFIWSQVSTYCLYWQTGYCKLLLTFPQTSWSFGNWLGLYADRKPDLPISVSLPI